MSKQLRLGRGFEKHAKTRRREKILDELDRIVSWSELCGLAAPKCPGPATGDRPKTSR